MQRTTGTRGVDHQPTELFCDGAVNCALPTKLPQGEDNGTQYVIGQLCIDVANNFLDNG